MDYAPSGQGNNSNRSGFTYEKCLHSALRNLTAGAYSGAMNRRGSQAAKNRPDPHDANGFGQVLPFRRPGQPLLPVPPKRATDTAIERPAFVQSDIERSDTKLPDDLAQFEQDRDEIVDYRHRALMNVIALAVVTFLVGTGVWLADTIAAMERDQDCVMQGRVNCAPVILPEPPQQ